MSAPDMSFWTKVAEVGGTGLVAAGAIIIAFRKAMGNVNGVRIDAAEAGGKIDMLNNLRAELARMAEQNTQLATMLNDLQIEVVKLRGENSELTTTVRHLHAEVRFLRGTTGRSILEPGEDHVG